MIRLEPHKGIPSYILLIMSVLGAFSVANLYYNQALLELICQNIGITQVQANLITVVTQVGYALGLLLVIPLADMLPVRRIVISSMTIASVSAVVIATASNAWLLWSGSFFLGLCSITPQLFIPMATLYSVPADKARNLGYMVSGVMLGILSARVLSGYIGEWFGWRAMFWIIAGLMFVSMAVSLRCIPQVRESFRGTYAELMKTVGKIFCSYPRIRLYSLRPAMGFASMLVIWSCMAFHLAQPPFNAGSDAVGMLGLCGVVGALLASGIGRLVGRLGVLRMSVIGALCQLTAWATVLVYGDCYTGMIAGIILADIGAQFQQISNQSGCLQVLPEATNRLNTIFMTSLFICGSLGTLCAAIAWQQAGWAGVCITGMIFASLSLLLSAYDRVAGMSR